MGERSFSHFLEAPHFLQISSIPDQKHIIPAKDKSNLFHLSAKKAQMMALRINMISKKTVRQKLEAYFDYMMEKTGSIQFETEMSLSQLSSYLCVDRTSLMREMRLMREEGILKSSGRNITLLNAGA